jgi:hypothetical protein
MVEENLGVWKNRFEDGLAPGVCEILSDQNPLPQLRDLPWDSDQHHFGVYLRMATTMAPVLRSGLVVAKG